MRYYDNMLPTEDKRKEKKKKKKKKKKLECTCAVYVGQVAN